MGNRRIDLGRGKFTYVDEEDWEKVKNLNWKCRKDSHGYEYAVAVVTLHRFVMDAGSGEQVDHKDRDGLNNTKENLRICTHSQNIQNQRPQKNSSSKFKGVSFDKKRGKWRADIQANNVKYRLGHFISEIEAAIAYNEAALKHHGEFAYINDVGGAENE